MQNRYLLRQSLWVWFFTIVAIRLLQELRFIPFIQNNVTLFTAIVLIYTPLVLLWRQKSNLIFFEKSLGQIFSSVVLVGILSLAIFPVLQIANHYFETRILGHQFLGHNYFRLGRFLVYHLILIALPEEFFYRGYLQTQLNKVWGKPYRLLGAQFGPALFVTAIIFAFSHSLISFQWWHFAIFFPALVFGYLREKTGAITAGILFHTLSNGYNYWVHLNYH